MKRLSELELKVMRARGNRELNNLATAALELLGDAPADVDALLVQLRDEWGACEREEVALVLAELRDNGRLAEHRGRFRREAA